MNYEALMKKQLLHMPAYRLPPQISDMMKQYGVDHIEKMAANENVFGVSDHVKEVVAEEMQNICRYPGDRNQELFEQIGKKYGIPSDCVQINVGATGVLNGIADTFLGVGDEIVKVMSKEDGSSFIPQMLKRNRLAGLAIKDATKKAGNYDIRLQDSLIGGNIFSKLFAELRYCKANQPLLNFRNLYLNKNLMQKLDKASLKIKLIFYRLIISLFQKKYFPKNFQHISSLSICPNLFFVNYYIPSLL